MYITQWNHTPVELPGAVMGAFDSDRYVIANIEQDQRWISVDRTIAVDLSDTR